jgi:tRNA (guanine-N7-)-methyltransferase
MGKDKLIKWAENKTFAHVFEPDLLPIIREGKTFMKGEWGDFFGNKNPITLELGCGKGEYTVGLAKKYPNRNFIGVDVKGHRFHKGAKEAMMEGLKNVAFLRTRIEFIESFFAPNEISEIWLTFSDPQPQDKVGVRRITSMHYAKKYAHFLRPGGLIHIKHDNDEVYRLALLEFQSNGYSVEMACNDIYTSWIETINPDLREILEWKTFYEQMWIGEGRKIKYLKIRTPQQHEVEEKSTHSSEIPKS